MPGPFRPSGLLPVVAASSTRALPDLSFMQDDDVSPAPPPSKPTSHPRKTEVLVIADDEDEEEHEALTSTSKQGSDRKVQRERNETALLQLDAEISDVDYQISQLQSLRSSLLQDRHVLVMSLSAQQALTRTHEPSTPKKPAGTIDYGRKEGFSWSDEIKSLAREVWGIKAFRLCQEAAINASMDGKDVVVVMPTGKSLISLQKGVTYLFWFYMIMYRRWEKFDLPTSSVGIGRNHSRCDSLDVSPYLASQYKQNVTPSNQLFDAGPVLQLISHQRESGNAPCIDIEGKLSHDSFSTDERRWNSFCKSKRQGEISRFK